MTEKERQRKATQIAKEYGYDRATYIGERDGLRVFFPESDEPTTTGLPCFITFDENDNPETMFGFSFMDLVEDNEQQTGDSL